MYHLLVVKSSSALRAQVVLLPGNLTGVLRFLRVGRSRLPVPHGDVDAVNGEHVSGHDVVAREPGAAHFTHVRPLSGVDEHVLLQRVLGKHLGTARAQILVRHLVVGDYRVVVQSRVK